MVGHRIEFSGDSLNLGLDVVDNGRIAIATIAGAGTSLRARHHAAALELQSVNAPHHMPVQRLTRSTGAVRLRYREHATGVDGETHWLAVIAENAAPMMILPEQAGSWAYPSASMDREETIASLSLGLLGRLYLSGYLPQLSQDQLALVREAVAIHRELRDAIRSLVPRWPLGLPGWDDSWAAFALAGPDVTLLTGYHRGSGPAEAAVPLSWLVGVPTTMEPVFPSELADWSLAWDPITAVLNVRAPDSLVSARTVAVRTTN